MRWWVILALGSGCYHPSEIASCSVACGPNLECPATMHCGADHRCTGESEDCNVLHPDAQLDADADGHTGSNCWGGNGTARLGMLCPTMTPTAAIQVATPLTINTSNCTTDQGLVVGTTVPAPGGGQACLIAGTDVTVSSSVYAYGTKPLIVLATGSLSIAGGVRFSLTGGDIGMPGPGAGSCPNSGPGLPDPTGAGGGAGGSYGTFGSSGGASVVSEGHTNSPLFAGDVLVGGCDGTNGGAGMGVGASPGGGGGGAVWLVAGTQINSVGTIDASGQGGKGGVATSSMTSGDTGAGGGGGGAGGLVALDAPLVTVTGTIIANGGGGGGGAGDYNPGNNANAEDGRNSDPVQPYTVAAGGSPTAVGSPGGGGASAAGGTPSTPGAFGKSGGGGGGGLGIIEFLSPVVQAGGASLSPIAIN